MICRNCPHRREMLQGLLGRLSRYDLLILAGLLDLGATEPQTGASQDEIWRALQTEMGFAPCREGLLGLVKMGLAGRTNQGRRAGFYLTEEGREILTL